jgi:hypothetical protein
LCLKHATDNYNEAYKNETELIKKNAGENPRVSFHHEYIGGHETQKFTKQFIADAIKKENAAAQAAGKGLYMYFKPAPPPPPSSSSSSSSSSTSRMEI